MGQRLPYIRIQWFVKRKEGMSQKDFLKYWETKHADMARALPGFRQVAKRYTQFHCPTAYREKAAALGLPVLEYDGTSEMWVESVDDYAKHMSQDQIVETLTKDAENFMGPGTHVMIGYEVLQIGEPVPGLPTKMFAKL